MFGSGSAEKRTSILKGPPSRQAQKRLKRLSKFTSGISWTVSALSTLVILLITTAGTSLDKGGSPSDNVITGQVFSIVSVTTPYKDVVDDGSLAWTYRMYLSAGCAQPKKKIASDVGAYCIYSTPGRTFDLHQLLVKGDEWVENYQQNVRHLFDFKTPTLTAKNTVPKTIETALPFSLYMASMVFSALLLATVPRGCCGIKWFFGRKLLNMILAVCSIAFSTAASSILTVKVLNLKHQLQTGGFPEWVTDVTIGKAWLGLTYGSMILKIIALILLTVEFMTEDRHIRQEGRGGLLGMFQKRPTFMHVPAPEEDEKHLTMEDFASGRSRRSSAASNLPPTVIVTPDESVPSSYEPYRGQAVEPSQAV